MTVRELFPIIIIVVKHLLRTKLFLITLRLFFNDESIAYTTRTYGRTSNYVNYLYKNYNLSLGTYSLNNFRFKSEKPIGHFMLKSLL